MPHPTEKPVIHYFPPKRTQPAAQPSAAGPDSQDPSFTPVNKTEARSQNASNPLPQRSTRVENGNNGYLQNTTTAHSVARSIQGQLPQPPRSLVAGTQNQGPVQQLSTPIMASGSGAALSHGVASVKGTKDPIPYPRSNAAATNGSAYEQNSSNYGWTEAGKRSRRRGGRGGQGGRGNGRNGQRHDHFNTSSYNRTQIHSDLQETFTTRPNSATNKTMTHSDESTVVPIRRKVVFVRDYVKSQPVADEGSPDWFRASEVPTSVEICPWIGSTYCQPETIVGNRSEGPFDSTDEYLKTHHQFLREDACQHLRNAVEAVAEHPTYVEDQHESRSIGLYNKVVPVALTYSPRGVAVRVVFSMAMVGKSIRWKQSKRLISGSLVAITPVGDMFRTKCSLAIVAARPLHQLEKSPPSIDLYFPRTDEAYFDPSAELFMVEERSAYFEASRHTMSALRKMASETFPLQDTIVQVEATVDAPKYLKDNQRTRLVNAVDCTTDEADRFESVDILNSWPQELVFRMDETQQAALQRILTKRVAIVQGPPGTGKTHVSVEALKIMMEQIPRGGAPVIAACQTNHALDQLLRKVAEFAPDDFIRLGGRSQDTGAVKRRTLFEVRKEEGRGPTMSGNQKLYAIRQMRELAKRMKDLLKPLEPTEDLLDHNLMRELGVLTADQCKNLDGGDSVWTSAEETEGRPPLIVWAGKQVGVAERATDQTDFAVMPFDAEDAELEVEQIEEQQAEFKAQDDEDDIETLKGDTQDIAKSHERKKGVALSEADIKKHLAQSDMWRIPIKRRGAVYEYLAAETRLRILLRLKKLVAEYNVAAQTRQIGAWEQDANLLKEQRLIGMTTTGLSKYRALINSLAPKIVLIEEAAETLEAPVTTACMPSVEHLVLVGDHKQLRPHCNVRDFEKPEYAFNLSMFERLVNNTVEYSSLRMQRRMIPEIRRILKPIYGNLITDHPSTKDVELRPHVPGMGGNNSIFFTHDYEEQRDEMMSCFNRFEADMIVGFFVYLCRNETPVEKITVLTFYNAQRKLILRCLYDHPHLKGRGPFNVVTVDSYQGEENDVVILSLVRNNNKGAIGFLNVVNRVCVALSRARRGLYLFGNAGLLAAENSIWSQVISHMIGETGRLPPTGRECRVVFWLHLFCALHERWTFVNHPEIWLEHAGGCDRFCGDKLPCGHDCLLRCHPFPHEDVICAQPCTRVLTCGHRCNSECFQDCYCWVCGKSMAPVVGDTTRQDVWASASSASESGMGVWGVKNKRSKDKVVMKQAAPVRRAGQTAKVALSTSPIKEYRKQVHQWDSNAQGERQIHYISDTYKENAPSATIATTNVTPTAFKQTEGILIDFD